MQFGNAAWGFRETPIERQFEITSQMGLSALEIGVANAPNDIPLDVSEDELKKIKELSKKYSVNITYAATGNDFTIGNADTEKVKIVIDICRKLDVKNLRIFTGFTALENITDEIFSSMINSLSEVCNYAKENDVVPVIETHGGVNSFYDGVEHFMSSTTDIKTFRKILLALPDNVRICYDPANLYAVGIKNPERFYLEFADKVAYAHFKDFKTLPSGHLKPSYCGDSSMNWMAILKSMKDFDGICFFEYENTEDIYTGLKKSYSYINGLIKEV